jgi:hypothetical protein
MSLRLALLMQVEANAYALKCHIICIETIVSIDEPRSTVGERTAYRRTGLQLALVQVDPGLPRVISLLRIAGRT